MINSILQTEIAKVLRINRTRPGAQELTVLVGETEARAINYTELLGEVEPQEQVLLNVTAVRAGLGTGGYHFVMKRAGKERPATEGNIVKLRYTPLQFRCRTVEEEGGPVSRGAWRMTEDLGDISVIVAPLHSHLPAAAAGVKALVPQARVVYIMTDTAALPFAFSNLAPQLKEAGIAGRRHHGRAGVRRGVGGGDALLRAARRTRGAGSGRGNRRAGPRQRRNRDGVGVRLDCARRTNQRGDRAGRRADRGAAH